MTTTTLKTTITYHPMLRVWSWTITQGRKTLASGYCRTKRDARNDAGVWVGMHEDAQVRMHWGNLSALPASTTG